MPDSGDRLVWIDLETTGLDPEASSAKILEFALVVTDDQMLEPVYSQSFVVEHDYIDLKSMTPEVVAMHTDSGLLEALLVDCTPWPEIAREATEVVANVARGPGAKKPLLAGNSVHFDRKWLARFAPSVDPYLHYRNLDVSAIYEMLLRTKHRDRAIFIKEDVPTAHRAIKDVMASIRMFREFRALCTGDF